MLVSHVLQYPDYGVLQKVRYRKGGATWTNIRQPNAEVFNVEGNTTTSLNNYGLPGSDIVNFDNPVVLLGSSYVEALQYQPEEIASSIVEDEIIVFEPSIDVVNLGCSGHDPYDSYFRLKYYVKAQKFNPKQVILIIDSDYEKWFARHPKPLNFELPRNFGERNQDALVNLQIKLRNASSLVNLYVNGLIKTDDEPPENTEHSDDGTSKAAPNGMKQPYFGPELKDCLLAFDREYENFKVVSILDSKAFDLALRGFCENNRIEYEYFPLTTPAYLIGGAGHLNKQGNEALGKALAEYIKKSSSLGV